MNWLRAKARWSRCLEQKVLVGMEMMWTFVGMYRQSCTWTRRMGRGSPGMQAYAAKQAAIWMGFAQRAAKEFSLKSNQVDDLTHFVDTEG